MPFIHIRAYSGRDEEMKRKAAEAIVKAAADAMDIPATAFSLVYEDINKVDWENGGSDLVVDPLRDMLLIEHGLPV